jgi:hypothetical protein
MAFVLEICFRKLDRFWVGFSAQELLSWEGRRAMKAAMYADAQKASSWSKVLTDFGCGNFRKAGISQATTSVGGGTTTFAANGDVAWLTLLKDEKAKLRKLLAEFSLDRAMASGRHPPKTLRPARGRKVVDVVCSAWDI